MVNITKTLTDYPFVDELVYYTKILALNAVIKNEEQALRYETTESLRDGNMYISCIENRINFDTLAKFPTQILREAYPHISEDTLLSYATNKNNIPKESRHIVVETVKNNIINNYEEKNKYYRMLAGLPAIGEDPIFVPKNLINDELNVRWNLPIHELSINEINLLETYGIIEQLKSMYPSANYINYMGDMSIDFYTSRKAMNFQILYLPSIESIEIFEKFKAKYEQNRIFTIRTIYSDAFKYGSDYYDNFIIIFILIQTIVDIISEVQEFIVRKEIFDARSIKYIFESYGIDYYDDIPIKYQIAMVKNINTLIKYKSSTKNIIDICSLFGFNDIEVFKYYILKDRKIDDDGNFIFNYKKTDDGTIVDDNINNYDLKFIKVPIDEQVDDYIKQKTKYIEYDDIVNKDPYWNGEEDGLKIKENIINQELSVARTKYISIDAIYDLTKISFDLSYLHSMIFYKSIGDIISGREIHLFENIDTLKSSDKKVNPGDIILIDTVNVDNNEYSAYYIVTDSMTYSQVEQNDILLQDNIYARFLQYVSKVRLLENETVNRLYYSANKVYVFNTTSDATSSDIKFEEGDMIIILYDELPHIQKVVTQVLLVGIISNSSSINTFIKLKNKKHAIFYKYIVRDSYDENKYITDNIQPQEISKFDISLTIPKIKMSHNFKLTDVLSYLFALGYLYLNVDDTLIDTPTKVLTVQGFNFDADLDLLNSYIFNKGYSLDYLLESMYPLSNEKNYLRRCELTDLLTKQGKISFDNALNCDTFGKLVNMFKDNKEIYKHITQQMYEADNYEVYSVFKTIYDSLMIHQHNMNFFNLSNNTKASTWSDILEDRDSVLYLSYTNLKNIEDLETKRKGIVNTMIEVIYALDEWLDSDDFKNMYYTFPGISGIYVQEYIKKVINFFKSYKTHLLEINTVYKISGDFDKEYVKAYEDVARWKTKFYTGEFNSTTDKPNIINSFIINDSYSIQDESWISNHV